MEITVETKLIPVIGKPLKQSLSYKMGNIIYQMEGLNYFRFPIEVDKEYLGQVLNGLKHMNLSGIGITKPYKIEVMKYLDEIDELAKEIGAVNSVEVKAGKLIGKNKDGEGFVRALKRETGCDIARTVFLCIGAGGAGRAICWTLCHENAKKILIIDKFDDSSRDLANGINARFPGMAVFIPSDDTARIERSVSEADVLMNTSGVGMAPDLQATPLPKEFFVPGRVAFDATYNPTMTQFLKEAEKAGCKTFNGKGMLIECGMLGFEERTGRSVPYETWSEVFDRVMEGSEIGRA
jgi:shikimate dehydrogenase